jgi:hypothetical protein
LASAACERHPGPTTPQTRPRSPENLARLSKGCPRFPSSSWSRCRAERGPPGRR